MVKEKLLVKMMHGFESSLQKERKVERKTKKNKTNELVRVNKVSEKQRKKIKVES